MVEPVNPVEGSSKNAEGQASIMADIVRERYWKQLAQKMPPVESGAEADKPENKTGEKVQADDHSVLHTRHTFAEFEVNKETREVLVRIFDAQSGELVRTIPPDELAKEIIKGNFQPNQLRRRAVFI